MSDYTLTYDTFRNSYIFSNFQIHFKRNRTTFAAASGVFRFQRQENVFGGWKYRFLRLTEAKSDTLKYLSWI